MFTQRLELTITICLKISIAKS